ncbi:hypothetical protein ZIOFF_023328 [Zingiber officinale]|uniref:Uncharacterized protein n=1 Tax=Zingiber officinale TaxID=94328 RepID=A0A8J5H426_ZINOF|nr:hypothetical protein ZIOFF_023328 [Zingiber officinale]
MTKYGSRSRPVTRSYTRDHINLVSELVMGDTDPITSKLEAFMERLMSQQQVFMEQITSCQQGLEEQIFEISRTVQDARRRPLHTANNPTSAEYDPSRGLEGPRPLKQSDLEKAFLISPKALKLASLKSSALSAY